MKKFNYFAYGSNMLSARLNERTPSAHKISHACLSGYRLTFSKASKDGSGKCHIEHTANNEDFVIGVIFEIDESERSALDKAEGLGKGYDHSLVEVSKPCGTKLKAHTYIGTSLDKSLKPYYWYKSFVVAGAKEHELPKEYIDFLEATQAIEDTDQERRSKNEQILARC